MARIEKTVFISYRRTDVYTALAVYESLKNQGYNVFFDYRSIPSGDFEQIIVSNIKARAHFLLILTSTALDSCDEPGDWLRREIEIAMDEKRNIVPLFFKGFRFGTPSVSEKLTGKLKNLSHYNGLNVHEDYFDEAMHRLRMQYLNIPLETVLHPISTEVQKIVRDEQVAADRALEHIEDVKELVKQSDQKSNHLGRTMPISRKKMMSSGSRLSFRLIGGIAGGLLILSLLIWATAKLLLNLQDAAPQPTKTSAVNVTLTLQPSITATSNLESADMPSRTATSVPPTSAFSTGSKKTGKDGMTLLYIPAGKFIMGSNNGEIDEKPMHQVDLDAFWIDQTPVTNVMYAKCVQDGRCNRPSDTSYYDNPGYANHPVVYVSWNDAQSYCTWVNRRLPSEAEWEKAARGTDGRTYPWGNDAPNKNSLNYNSWVAETSEVGKYLNNVSPYEAVDMAGNVSEWVKDWYSDAYYSSSPPSNPTGPDSGNYRVLRGGSWVSSAYYVRSAARFAYVPTTRVNFIGFRCAMSTTP